jgi:DNA helicase IV
MDIALIVKFLAPCLPFLLTTGGKVAEGASQKVGEDVWNKAKAIWGKLQPKVEAKEEAKNAAAAAMQNPGDEDYQAALRAQLKDILKSETALAEEVAKILQETKSHDDSVSLNAESYGESIQINTAGNVNQPAYDFSKNINSPK